MNNQNIFKNSQEENQFWAAFGYIEEGMVYCPMCEDTHANNTNCQRND